MEMSSDFMLTYLCVMNEEEMKEKKERKNPKQ